MEKKNRMVKSYKLSLYLLAVKFLLQYLNFALVFEFEHWHSVLKGNPEIVGDMTESRPGVSF